MEMEAPNGSEGRWSQVATTLPVRNVQALAASADEQTAETIERYIRPDIDRDAVLTEHSGEVPVIDLSKLRNPQSVEGEAAKLRFACEEWGFFQLVNHGIPEEVIVNIKRDIQKFFQLPLKLKNAYAQRPGDRQGYGQVFVVSDEQKLDWADMFGILAQPPQARDMRYWPNQPHAFRNSIEEYSLGLMKVAHSVVTFIAKTLNIDLELMGDKYVVQILRMNYYPPCMSMPEKVLGLSPHSDGSFLTLLLEVNSVEGLQIRRQGAWIPVKPHDEALLVNVGDFLEIMTNGKYKSIEHRVTINAYKERLSISAFHIPKYDGIVSPVLGITEEKVLYKTVRVEEYAKLYLSSKLDGKKALDHAKVTGVVGHGPIVRWLAHEVEPVTPVEPLMFGLDECLAVALEVSGQLAKFVLLVERKPEEALQVAPHVFKNYVWDAVVFNLEETPLLTSKLESGGLLFRSLGIKQPACQGQLQ